MKKNLLTVTAIFVLMSVYLTANSNMNLLLSSGCSVAGTAASSADSICYEDTIVMSLTGYVGAIQWQSYDGVTWNNETGIGSTTDAYSVVPGQTTEYRAMVTDLGCPPDSSNIVTIIVGTIPVPSGTGATRCGYGQVTLTGTGSGTLNWYTVPTGGTPAGTGSSFSPFVGATTTFYLEDNTFSGSLASPIMVTEADLDDFNGADDLEIMNVAPYPVDVTGWQVAVGDDYATINPVNPVVQTLNGIMAPGQTMTWTDDAGAPNYWGANLFWTGGSNTLGGWIAIIDDNNVLVEIAVWGFTDPVIQAASLVINGNTYTIGSQWIGDGANNTASTGFSLSRQGNSDHNDSTDWAAVTNSIGTLNPGMINPFNGLGCSSPRVPVIATVTSADSVTINAGANALCLGDSTTLTASSNNGGYSYTWSPPTGLSSTTGSMVTANPTTTITYTVVGDDGTCADIDSITISVGPTSVAGTATISTDTICSGTNATLFLTGYTGNIQWQSFNGSVWVNETGAGNNTAQYQVAPTANIQYRAVITSGGCPPDTSIVLNLEVLTITDPVTVNDTICGPGVVNLTATGAGVLNWFTTITGGVPINTGNAYSPNISVTTTYYVEASAGGTFNVGPASNGFGSQNIIATNDWGLQFDVIQQATIEKVYVYPGPASGSITINLRDMQGGPILNTITASVTAFSGKTPIALGFIVNPNTGYRLELATGSVDCYYNSSNAAYPYTIAGSPVTITGYVNPTFQTGVQYYYFYDWEVTEGCKSNRIPVTGVVLTVPPVPSITQFGNQLTSSSPVNNQWYLNGVLIPGATSQIYNAVQPGSYTVVVTDPNGCSSVSLPVIITSVMELAMQNGITIYPNPADENIVINFSDLQLGSINLKIINALGEVVQECSFSHKAGEHHIDIKNVAKGNYFIEIKANDGVYRSTFVKM